MLRGQGLHNRRSVSLNPLLSMDMTQPGLDPRILSSRASAANTWDATGSLVSVPANTPRQTYLPGVTGQTVAQGLLCEPAGENYIRNPLGVGAIAGTPGTLPTYWTSGLDAGLSQTIVGSGVESGISYVDIRVFGVATASGGTNIYLETSTSITAASGQIWTASAFVRVVGGSVSNITGFTLGVLEWNASGTYVANGNIFDTTVPTGNPLAQQQRSLTRQLNGGVATAYINSYYGFSANTGATIDITLRIGLPQLEQSTVATSPMTPSVGNTGVSLRADDTNTNTAPLPGTNSYDVLFQDAAGGEWRTVSGPTLPLTPRSGQTSIRRVRAYQHGVIPASLQATMAVPY